MMVNVSRFVPVQKAVRDFLSLREKKIREAVLANYAMPEEVSARNAYMQGLKHAFDAEYADAGFTWAEVKAALSGVFEHLEGRSRVDRGRGDRKSTRLNSSH